MHPSVLLLLISVPWMILDRVSSSPVPPFELQYDDNEIPDVRDVVLCIDSPKWVCYTFKVRGKVNIQPISDSKTRARREVNPKNTQDEDEEEEIFLEQQGYAKEREQELLDLKKEQEELQRKG